MGSIILLISENTKSLMSAANYKSEFVVLKVDSKLLVGIVVEGLYCYFFVGSNCKSFIMVKCRYNLIGRVSTRFEFRCDITFFFLISYFRFLNGHDEPNLVAVVMDVVLEDSFSLDCFASGQVERSVASMSLDDITFISIRSFVYSDDLEPTAVVLSTIRDNLCSVVLLITEYTQSMVVLWCYKSVFSIFYVNLKFLERSSLVAVRYDLISLLIHSKSNRRI